MSKSLFNSFFTLPFKNPSKVPFQIAFKAPWLLVRVTVLFICIHIIPIICICIYIDIVFLYTYSQDAEERTYLPLVRWFGWSLIFKALNDVFSSDLKNGKSWVDRNIMNSSPQIPPESKVGVLLGISTVFSQRIRI